MKKVTLYPSVTEVLDDPEVKEYIKVNYHSEKLFVDSAIRAEMRRNKIPVGNDQIVTHRKKLANSRAKNLLRQRELQNKRRHAQRMRERREQMKNN